MKTLGDKYKGKERQRTNLADRLGSFRLKDIGKALALHCCISGSY